MFNKHTTAVQINLTSLYTTASVRAAGEVHHMNKCYHHVFNTVSSLVTDYPWGREKWSLTGGGCLWENLVDQCLLAEDDTF